MSASEIASWAWCPESWRLEALGERPQNPAALARGRAFHERTAGTVVWTRRVTAIGMALFVVALLLTALWLAIFRGEG
ncbi:MAG: hypothetical protein U0871_01040 [Gemmataceae bacterium]